MKKAEGGSILNKALMNAIISAVIAVSAVILLILLSFTLFLLIDSSFFTNLPVRPYSIYLIIAISASVILLVVSLVFLFRSIKSISLESKESSSFLGNSGESTQVQFDQDAIKYLDEGEREIYMILVDAGGTVLQRDIASVKGYSKATITRILTRLEAKGLVERIRHGTTNQIVLKRVSKQVSQK
ncbi:MAG: helix-turn-helix transcriptional regulator [Thermoplasmata archaeon]